MNNRIQREQRELSSLETTKKHQERELQEKNSELEGNCCVFISKLTGNSDIGILILEKSEKQ